MASEEGNNLVINDVDDEPTPSTEQPEKPSTPLEKSSTPPEKPSTPPEKPSTPPEKPSTPPTKPSPPLAAVPASTKKAWNEDGNYSEKIPPEDIRWTPEWKERWRKLLRMQLSGWTSVSTLHGVIYIGEAGRHWFERYMSF